MTDKITIEGIELPIKPTPASKIWPALQVLSKDAQLWVEVEWDRFHDALFWGIRRAGGEVTKEWLALNVDMHNLEHVMTTFARVNTLSATTGGSASGGDTAPPTSETGSTLPST
jgi:hypothetical protein